MNHTLNLQILMEIIMDRGVNVLLEDLQKDTNKDINTLGECLSKCAEALEQDTNQLPAQIIAYLKDHNSPVLQSLVQEAHDYSDSTWLRPRHQMLSPAKTDIWVNQDAHNAFIGSIVALPDNERFVTASEDGTIKVWHIDGSLLETLTDHDDAVNSVKLSPDKTRLLAVSDDETGSSRPISTWVPDVTFNGHSDYVSEVAQTTTDRVITTSSDETARIFDAKTGKCLHTLEGHRAWVYGLAVSPDGTRAITSSLNNKMVLWDVETGQQVKCIVGEGAAEVTTVMGLYIAPDNDTDIGHRSAPYEMRWSEDGTRVVSVHEDIIVWDACDDVFVEVMRLDGHDWQIQDLALFDNDTKLITVAHSIKIWDLKTGEELACFSGHENDEIYSVAITPDEQYFFTGDTDGTLKCWHTHTVLNDTSITGHMSSVSDSIFITKDGQTVLTAASDSSGILWDSNTGHPIHHLTGHGDLFVTSFGFIKDETQCVTTCKGALYVWDVTTGEEVRRLDLADNTLFNFHGLHFYDNDTKFVCGAACYPVYKGDFETGQFVQFQGNTGFASDFAFTGDERYVLSSTYFSADDFDDDDEPASTSVDLSAFEIPKGFEDTCPVQLWDVEQNCLSAQYYPTTALGTEDDPLYPDSVMWRDNETRVMGFYSDGSVYTWDRASGEVVDHIQAVDGFIYGSKILDNDILVVIAENAPNIRGWHLPSKKIVFEFSTPNETFERVVFNKEGNLVAGLIDNQTVCIVDIKAERVLATFTNQYDIRQMKFCGEMIAIGDAQGFMVSLDLVHGHA